MRDISSDSLLIFTNFSATTCDVKAAQLDHCSQDDNAVLTVYIVCHSQRDIQVEVPNGNRMTIKCARINNRDVWYFFGDTVSKGKKNDNVSHNA
jgi:hypothetical protein